MGICSVCKSWSESVLSSGEGSGCYVYNELFLSVLLNVLFIIEPYYP